MEANVKWTGGLQFVGRADSGHALVMDATPEVGGADSGIRPLELLLVGLGGCTGIDVISILEKMQAKIVSFEMKLTADRAAEHPKVLKRIDVEYVVRGHGIRKDQVKRAVELSMDKYCSVSNTLRSVLPVSYSYRLEEV